MQFQDRIVVERKWVWVIGMVLFLSMSGRTGAEDAAAATPESESPPGQIEFVGKNLIANAEGTFHAWRVVENEVDFSELSTSSVTVEIDLSSIDTKNKSRDDHLRTADFFDVEQYPTARAKAYNLVQVGESKAGRPRYSISFDIDLHGISKTVQGEAELVEVSPAIVEGDLEVNRVDFGIGEPASRWNPMSIEEIIPIHFRVEL